MADTSYLDCEHSRGIFLKRKTCSVNLVLHELR